MSLELQQAIQSYENYISDNGIDESVIDAMTVRQKYWEECGELLKNAA